MSNELITNLLFFKDELDKKWKLCKVKLAPNELIINQLPKIDHIKIILSNISQVKIFNYEKNTAILIIEYIEDAKDNELTIKIPKNKIEEIKNFLLRSMYVK